MDALIKQSMLDGDKNRTKVLRAIKNEFMVWQTAKNAAPLDEAAEVTILRKMVKQRLDSRDQYLAAGREELAYLESKEILVLNSFLPTEASVDEIIEEIYNVAEKKDWITGNGTGSSPFKVAIPKKCMGEVIKMVKAKFDNVDSKLLADTIKSFLV